MLQPLRNNASRRRTGQQKPVKAPYGGWNARDDYTDMPPEDALVLDNLIPGDASVSLRKGKSRHCDGIGTAVLSLMEYSPPSGGAKLFAATADKIFDATVAGSIDPDTDDELDDLSNGYWQHTMFATSGGNFLLMVNGADGLVSYSGSSWTVESLSGVTAANLVTITAHQSRVWMIEEGTMKVWYLDALAKSGTATAIDFAALSNLGGKLMAMASWTRDSGVGIEDLAVFITSQGQVHIYQGSDPSSAETWSRVGTFKIAEPIGRRCLIKVGGDVGILTTQGLVPLSGVLAKAESAQGQVAITDKIRAAYTDASIRSGAMPGWQITEYPVGKLLIVNVPIVEAVKSEQFVMNSVNGKWCRFTGLDAGCWSLLDGSLYFGGLDGIVWKYDRTSDDGEDIQAKSVSAFANFGVAGDKTFDSIQPMFFGPTGYRPQVGLRIDYGDDEYLSEAVQFDSSGTAWNEGDWDDASWAPPSAPNRLWQSVVGEGSVAAVVVVISMQEQITYNGAMIRF
jgi:hypothetical protein